MDLSKCKCQEANLYGLTYPGPPGDPIPCGQPGEAVVFHQNDGHHVYIMCGPCAYHNVKNRGGIELVPANVGPLRDTSNDTWTIEEQSYGRYLITDGRCRFVVHQLIDGSGRKDKYPNGQILSKEAAKQYTESIVKKLNS